LFKKLNHVSHIVKNLDEAIKLYSNILHIAPWEMGVITVKDVRLVWLPLGDNFIELIEPLNNEGRFGRQLKEKGEGFFHISILAEDYDAEIKALMEKGYKMEEESLMFGGIPAKLAFLSPEETKGAWIEIVDIDGVNAAFKKPGRAQQTPNERGGQDVE
jgi:methylmalonyl-CoA/ethylmalonyl-CoA epimerase